MHFDSKKYDGTDLAFSLSGEELIKLLATPQKYKTWLETANTPKQKINKLSAVFQAIEDCWQGYSDRYPTMPQLGKFIIEAVNTFAQCFLAISKSPGIHLVDAHLVVQLFTNLEFFKNQKIIFDQTSAKLSHLHELLNALASIADCKSSKNKVLLNCRSIMSIAKIFYDRSIIDIDVIIQSIAAFGKLSTSPDIKLNTVASVNFIVTEANKIPAQGADICLLLNGLGKMAKAQIISGQKTEDINDLLFKLVADAKSLSTLQLGEAIQGIRDLVEAQNLNDNDGLGLGYLNSLLNHFQINKPTPSTTQIAKTVENLAKIYDNVNSENNPLEFKTLETLWDLFIQQNQKAMALPSPDYIQLARNISEMMLAMSSIVRINKYFYADINASNFIAKIDILLGQLVKIAQKPKLPYSIIKSVIHSLRASVWLGRSLPNNPKDDPAALLFAKIKAQQNVILPRKNAHVLVDQIMFYATTTGQACTQEMKTIFEENQPSLPEADSREDKIVKALKALNFKKVRLERNLDYYPLDISGEIIIDNQLVRVNIELDGPTHDDLVGKAKGFFRDLRLQWSGHVHATVRIPVASNKSASAIAAMALLAAQNYQQNKLPNLIEKDLLGSLAANCGKRKKFSEKEHKKVPPVKIQKEKELKSASFAILAELAELEADDFTPSRRPSTPPASEPVRESKKRLEFSTPKKQHRPKKTAQRETSLAQSSTPKKPKSVKKIDLSDSIHLRDAYYIKKKNIPKCIRLANTGNVQCQNIIGACYAFGKGMPANPVEAKRLLSLAIKAGSPEAKLNLGNMYKLGIGVQKDWQEAAKLFKEVVDDTGSEWGQCFLGLLYREGGPGLPQNHLESVKYLQLAAEQGLPDAQVCLAEAYAEGKGVKQNLQENIRLLQAAAEQNLGLAQHSLANCFKQGRGVKQDHAEAFKLYSQINPKEYPQVYCDIADCYLNGNGIEQNEKKAVELLNLSVEHDITEAYYLLGYCYHHGRGVVQNKKEAARLYRKAAEQGDVNGQDALGHCYKDGEGVKTDNAAAIKWLRLASKQGSSDAQFTLGAMLYLQGVKEKKDEDKLASTPRRRTRNSSFEEAEKWLVLAKKQGNEDARLVLEETNLRSSNLVARLLTKGGYDDSKPVPVDKLMIDILTHSAYTLNEVNGQVELGMLYENGVPGILPQNLTKAVELYQKAAEKGSEEGQNNWSRLMREDLQPAHQYDLAINYFYGRGVECNKEKALQLLNILSANHFVPAKLFLGHFYTGSIEQNVQDPVRAFALFKDLADEGSADGELNLGKCYLAGFGTDQNKEKAHQSFKLAAAQKYAHAQYTLAVFYDTDSDYKDEKEAIRLYYLAAESGHAGAQCKLGDLYRMGTYKMAKDFKISAEWYRKAADQGLAEAQYHLGVFSALGEGVEKSSSEAMRLYQLAADQNHANAQFTLGRRYFLGRDVPQDAKTGWKLIATAAENGLIEAREFMACEYHRQATNSQYQDQAIQFYSSAAELGCSKSQYQLALCYFKGTGVPKDGSKALAYLQLAAQNEPNAMYSLACLHIYKKLSSPDLKEGIRLLIEATRQGLQAAQYRLAVLYLNGQFEEAQRKEGIYLLKLLVQKNYAAAQFTLAQCYQKGYRIAADEKEAAKLFELAARQGVTGQLKPPGPDLTVNGSDQATTSTSAVTKSSFFLEAKAGDGVIIQPPRRPAEPAGSSP